MRSDTTYFVVTVAMALAVIITCGAGITWNYLSAERWGTRKNPLPSTREHHESSPFADRSAEQERDEHRLAA